MQDLGRLAENDLHVLVVTSGIMLSCSQGAAMKQEVVSPAMYLHIAAPQFVWQGNPPFPIPCHTLPIGKEAFA